MVKRAVGFGIWMTAAAMLPAATPDGYFGIRVVDEETGRGVPMVELTTVNQVRFITDSAGWAAIDEPGMFGQEVHFSVFSHGYEYPADGFGYRGVRLTVEPGEREEIRVRRQIAAERMCRLTGEGIYRDTVLLGLEPPIENPVLNGGVVGQDSVHTAFYQDRLYWFWGDTGKLSYPLGNFHMSAATTPWPPGEGYSPEDGIEFDYFVDDTGFSRQMAPLPGDGPTWLSGIVALPDSDGEERLVAGYEKIRGLVEAYERGVVLFDDETGTFEKVAEFPLDTPLRPTGHPLTIGDDGFVYFCAPLPVVRVRATVEDFFDPDAYEGYTPLREGSRWEDRDVERDGAGRLVYGWKRATPTLDAPREAELVREGKLEWEETLFHLRGPNVERPVRLHNGTVAWNEYRKRWILVASEFSEEMQLSDVWFAESQSPQGPWENPRRIVTHDRYTFYNPKHHPFFDREGGRIIYFEGTYTKLFADREEPTPRYDYNQILYRLDLGGERMDLPVSGE